MLRAENFFDHASFVRCMCLGECEDMFPAIDRAGTTSFLIDLFVGSARIEGSVTIGEASIKIRNAHDLAQIKSYLESKLKISSSCFSQETVACIFSRKDDRMQC